MGSRLAAAGSAPEQITTSKRSALSRAWDWFVGRAPHYPEHIEALYEDSRSASGVWQQFIHPPDLKRLGVCSSGGGIRSASYNLGALQVLRRRGVLDKTEYLSAVSGGCYTAIAHTFLRAASEPETFPDDAPPWGPGSPEEQFLRNNTNYLAPGFIGKVWFGLWLLAGFLRQFLPFLAGAIAIGVIVGRGYEGWLDPAVTGGAMPSMAVGTWVTIGLGAATLSLVVLRQLVERAHRPPEILFGALQAWALRLLFLTLLAAFFGQGIPTPIPPLPPRGGTGCPLFSASGGITQLVPAIATFVGSAWLRKLAASKYFRLSRIVPVLTSLFGYLTLGVPAFLAARWVVVSTSEAAEAAAFVSAAAFLVVMWLFTDAVQPTMHLYYKDRLASAFVRLRARDARGRRALRSTQPAWNKDLTFSTLNAPTGAPTMPKLVVCATANLSDAVVPPGRRGASFTFEQDRSGGPLTGYVPTAALEAVAGPGVLTMPGLMAISGAAISPAMGKLSAPGLRLLMALFNVRLGVWLPNPVMFREIQDAAGKPLRGLGRMSAARGQPAPDQRPGPLYLLREGLGKTRLLDRYVYVTDGGHWDNLGLVELLRRGCGQVICLDAAGDKEGRFDTFAQAVALARAELGVIVDIDLGPLRATDDGPPACSSARGSIAYPDGTEGVLVYVKCIATSAMPVDAAAYRIDDPKFPYHSTSDQFFDDRQFEAYRGLGRADAEQAVEELSSWRAANNYSEFTS